MKQRKRLSALLLALCLCVGLIPPVSAQEERRITISDARGLLELSRNCTLDTWSEGVTVVLTADIDLKGVDFKPIPMFCGTFEGGGHRISGLSLTGKGSDQGLFRYIRPQAVVRNLTVEGEVHPGGSKNGLGLLAGLNEGTILKCVAVGSVTGQEDVGGLVGVNETTGLIRQCSVEVRVTGVTHTGGVAGRNEGTLDACVNRGVINNEANDSAEDTGGMAGSSAGTITACVNYGEIGYPHSGYNVGGIAGRQNGSVVGCENHGLVQGRKDVGGIVGQFEPYTVFAYGEDPIQKLDDELSKLSGLMTRLSDQVSSYSGDAVSDIQDINGAVNIIRDTANLAGNDGIGDAREAVDLIHASGKTINSSFATLLDHVDEFSATADKNLIEIGDALDDLRDVLDRGFADMDDALNDGKDSMDRNLSEVETQAERISSAIGELGDYLDAISGVAESVGDLGGGGTLSGVASSVRWLRMQDPLGAMNSIERAMSIIRRDLSAMRQDLGKAFDDLDAAANDTWDGAEAALDRVSGAADRLEAAFKGFSDAAANDMRVVNGAVSEIEDVLRQWMDAAGDKGGNALNSVDSQLQYIGDRMDRLTDGAASANKDLHGTTTDIIGQLDAVRAALKELGTTPEKTVDDISDAVEQEGAGGRLISCFNSGEIAGDANVGGMAGILATELGLDPEEDLDLDQDKILVDTTAYIKATVRDCRNEGAVTARNDCAGGIIGRGEVGAVLDCFNGGPVETTSGSQCGGVAGLSRTVIRRSYALCALTGNDKLGGVAGEGRDIRDCYTMVTIEGDGEQFGAVAGTADGEVERNYFVRESLAGIDGVDYAGKAEPMDYDAFTAVEGLPEEFSGLRITFTVDGHAVKSLSVPYGGDLKESDIPAVPAREGVYGAWEDFARKGITRSRTVEAVYQDWAETVATGEDQPLLLLEGAFAPETVLTAGDWTPETALIPAGYTLVAGYTYSVDARGEQEPEEEIFVRVRCGRETGNVMVAVLEDGGLVFTDARREGSYLVFPLAEKGSFALLEKPASSGPWIACGGALAAGLLFWAVKHKGGKKPKTPAAVK